jgi:hypothetical protein
MPDSVLTPAPVNATIRLPRSRAASASIAPSSVRAVDSISSQVCTGRGPLQENVQLEERSRSTMASTDSTADVEA